jgi:signal transduction histidine kinase
MTGREELYRRFLADEVASALRHRVVNKLAGLGALSFHLKRQLGQLPEAAATVFPLLDAELGQATAALALRFVPPPPQWPALPLGDAVAGAVGALDNVEVVGPRPPLLVAADGAELDLCLACLLENAVDAARTQVRVTVRASPDTEGGPLAVVEISDDGPGLAGEALSRAREPFFTTRPGRLGLGLNVASRIAERARGRLELDARDGQGLHVRLTLPEAR